jgi:Short C-terminal domain
MPGLLRGMARTAVVAGTATAVSNRVSRRQGERWAAQDAPAYPQQYEPPPQQYAAPPPSGNGESRVDKLKELASLKEQGVLTEEEFASEKARILAS